MCPGPKVFCLSSALVSGNQGSVATNGLHKSHTQKKVLFTGGTPCLGGEGRRAWWELFVSVPKGPLIWSSFEFPGWWYHQGRCLKHLCSVQVKLAKKISPGRLPFSTKLIDKRLWASLHQESGLWGLKLCQTAASCATRRGRERGSLTGKSGGCVRGVPKQLTETMKKPVSVFVKRGGNRGNGTFSEVW